MMRGRTTAFPQSLRVLFRVQPAEMVGIVWSLSDLKPSMGMFQASELLIGRSLTSAQVCLLLPKVVCLDFDQRALLRIRALIG